jgi:methionine-rich copper-binding protein CopC
LNIKHLAFTLMLTALLAVPVALSAHMKFEKSEPAPGSTVTSPLKSIQIWFSEVPDTKVSTVEVVGPSGPVKTMGLHAMGKSLMIMIDGTAAAGGYTVRWQSAGDDGHLQKGDYTFTLQAAK